MRFTTTLPVMTRTGPATTIDEEELQDSPHPEVRQAAFRGRTFVFGGVTFTPDVEALPYRGLLRITTPREVEVLPPGFLLTQQQRQSADAAIAARQQAAAKHDRVPSGQLGIVELVKHPSPAPQPKPRPSSTRAYAALTLVLCCLFGAGLGLLAAQHHRFDDVAQRWARWRDDVVVGTERRRPDLGVAASSTEWREGPGGSGEEVSP